MKKFTVLFVVFALSCMMVGCNSQVVTYNPAKPYWLNEGSYSNVVDTSVNEVCVYNVTYSEVASPNQYVKVSYDESTYTTTLKAEKFPAEKGDYCYVYSTSYDMKGKYTVDGTDYPFHDVTTTKVYFTWDSGFNFKYSERETHTTLPVNASATPDAKGNRVVTTAGKETITYSGSVATTTFEALENADYFGLKNGFNGTIKKITSANYVDYNLLNFALRSFDFSTSLSYTFYSADVISNNRHQMRFSSKGTVSENIKNLLKNGVPQFGTQVRDANGKYGEGENRYDYVLNAETFSFSVALNETYSGTAITCNYFSDEMNMHHYLYKMETPLPYNMGLLTYTLTEIKTN